MRERICNGCTGCCDRMVLPKLRVCELEATHPGWFVTLGDSDIGPMGKVGLLAEVTCTKVVPSVGCTVHPRIIGQDIRPPFCEDVSPNTCGSGTLIQIE